MALLVRAGVDEATEQWVLDACHMGLWWVPGLLVIGCALQSRAVAIGALTLVYVCAPRHSIDPYFIPSWRELEVRWRPLAIATVGFGLLVLCLRRERWRNERLVEVWERDPVHLAVALGVAVTWTSLAAGRRSSHLATALLVVAALIGATMLRHRWRARPEGRPHSDG